MFIHGRRYIASCRSRLVWTLFPGVACLDCWDPGPGASTQRGAENAEKGRIRVALAPRWERAQPANGPSSKQCRDKPNKMASAPLSVLCAPLRSPRSASANRSPRFPIFATAARHPGRDARSLLQAARREVATAATRRSPLQRRPPPRRIRPGRWPFRYPVSAGGRGPGTRCRVHAPVSVPRRWVRTDGRP
jgi:hypothetical protein